jgi:phosphoenolpyruvate-protein kinase (PTS system EI component)
LSAEKRLKGVPLSPGVAVGRACFYVRETAEFAKATPEDPRLETQRLLSALRWLSRQRSVLAHETEAKLGLEHAEIFRAHCLMLADETFRQQLVTAIEEKACSAEQAIETLLNRFMKDLGAADSEYLQQRVADISEIQHDLLDYLSRVSPCRCCKDTANCSVGQCQQGSDHILIGEEMSASLPIETDNHTRGFIVDKGGPNSHAVILARALRCPVVGNIRDLSSIPPEAEILIDGDSGEVILNPTAETLASYRGGARGGMPGIQASQPVAGLKVMANIQQAKDVSDVLAAGAEGIGLYRTEMELLLQGRLLSEAEQAARYSTVVSAMQGKPVCIRLLDLGSDKTADWLAASWPAGNVSGYRGARLLLAHPELLQQQARALARASVHGTIHVLYPMIASIEQFLELRTLFDQAVADLQPGRLLHGVLFEVPAACLAARQLLHAADFGCIGTNDLIQYLFAESRTDGGTWGSACFETDAVLWELIQQLSQAAAQSGRPMAICGELAGDPALTGRIMQAGITTVSTSPSQIAKVRGAAANKQK